MTNLSATGITSYLKKLPRGKKDAFVRKVAEVTEMSTSNVYRKFRVGCWTKIEMEAISRVIESEKEA